MYACLCICTYIRALIHIFCLLSMLLLIVIFALNTHRQIHMHISIYACAAFQSRPLFLFLAVFINQGIDNDAFSPSWEIELFIHILQATSNFHESNVQRRTRIFLIVMVTVTNWHKNGKTMLIEVTYRFAIITDTCLK